MMLFSLDADATFARGLAAKLGVSLAPHENRSFDDGEHKLRPLMDPRGSDAYVIHSLYGEPQNSLHDKLMQLLMFIATLREHGAARATAVLPYLAAWPRRAGGDVPRPRGVKRAQLWRESLEKTLQRPVGFAMVDKRRSAGLVSSDNLVASAAHSLFTGPAADALADDSISKIIVTDSVPPFHRRAPRHQQD